MTNRILLFLYATSFYFISFEGNCQANLVLNPSFESYTACPAGSGYDIQKAIGWNHARGSLEYFNACSTSTVQQVPFNYFGYQLPAGGNAYAGMVCYCSCFFYREILIGQLTSSLTVGQKYYCSYKISRSDYNGIGAGNGFSVNKAGFKFSKVTHTNVPINNNATYFSNLVISDTINWVNISSSFVADSAYKFILIGNFFDDLNTTIVADGNGQNSYYFIDEVCLSTDSMQCNTVTKINSLQRDEWMVYPNPCSDHLLIKQPHTGRINYYAIYDLQGKTIHEKTTITSDKIDMSTLKNGFYFIKLITNDQTYFEKILVSH